MDGARLEWVRSILLVVLVIFERFSPNNLPNYLGMDTFVKNNTFYLLVSSFLNHFKL